MKILLLGMNYASTLNSLVSGFKEHNKEIQALSFEENRSVYNNFNQIHCIYPNKRLSYFQHKWRTIRGIYKLYRSIKKADIIHVYSNLNLPTKYEEKLLRFFFLKVAKHKKKYITFVGSEVRIPEIDFAINPFYKEAFQNPDYEYQYESKECSLKHQKKFHDLGFELICTPDTAHYISPQFFQVNQITFHAGTATNSLFEKESSREDLLIVHAPSAPIAKGSNFIRQVMSEIMSAYPQVKYIELQHVSNQQYQEIVETCDIYIDQIIWGFHGVAAIQALSLKKPVICFLHENLTNYLSDCPIINANQNNLFEIVEQLILNKENLEDIGLASYGYYQNNHAPFIVSKKLIEYYYEKHSDFL